MSGTPVVLPLIYIILHVTENKKNRALTAFHLPCLILNEKNDTRCLFSVTAILD